MPHFVTILLTAYDGALAGASLAFLAGTTWVKYLASSSTLRDVRNAPSARVSDLRSLLEDHDDRAGGGMLVFVRGQIQLKPSGIPGWLGLKNYGSLVSQRSGEPAVLVQHTDTYLYGDCSLFRECWSTVRSVPFVLAEGGEHCSSYVNVSLESSIHPLPLVHPHLHPLQYPSYSNIWKTVFQMYPVRLMKDESILPIGKEITAVGICRDRDGDLEIRSCMQLPYFLTDMTKVEIEANLTRQTKFLFWGGIMLGTLSISILGYAVIRTWQRRRKLRNGRQNCGSLHGQR